MAFFNISGNLGQLSLGANDQLYLAPTGSIISAGAPILMGSNASFNVDVAIDGRVIGTTPSAVILLNGTNAAGSVTGVGSYQVSIGATGVVRSITAGLGILTVGTQNTVVNNGLVDTIGTGIVNNGSGYTLLNTGTVTSRANGISVVGGTSIVTNTGSIGSVLDAAIDMFGNSNTLRNSGTLSGNIGINVDGDSTTVINSGQIIAAFGVTLDGADNIFTNTVGGSVAATIGLLLDGAGIATRVTNAGSLMGAVVGIIAASASTQITNHGVIEGAHGSAIQATDTAISVSIVNTGTIRGNGLIAGGFIAIEGDIGVETITNTGVMIGGLTLAAGADVVTNTGIIRGNVDMGAGADRVTALEGRIFGSILSGAGNDTVVGGAQADTVLGGVDNDLLLGGAGDDDLQGGAGADRIIGGLGNDRITAGAGTDVLAGGLGADVFVFTSKATLGIGAGRDQITDFAYGVDDLNMVFMNSYIGSAAFTAAGQVRYVQATGVLSGNTDADVSAEWTLLLVNKPVITASDFVF